MSVSDVHKLNLHRTVLYFVMLNALKEIWNRVNTFIYYPLVFMNLNINIAVRVVFETRELCKLLQHLLIKKIQNTPSGSSETFTSTGLMENLSPCPSCSFSKKPVVSERQHTVLPLYTTNNLLVVNLPLGWPDTEVA